MDAAGGSLVTARFLAALAAALGQAAPKKRWQALTLADYEQRLSLTPDQVGKLKPIFGLTRRKLAPLRANTAERVAEVLREMNQQVMAELSPYQQGLLRQLLAERRTKRVGE